MFCQLICCTQKFHWSPQYDWVAVYDLTDKNFEARNGIDKYLFAQVRLLFSIEQDQKVHHLAYLEWYDIIDIPDNSKNRKMVSRDPETGMAIARRSGKSNVVSVNAIVRGVHMQPLFEERDSARTALAKGLDAYSFNSYVLNKYADRISWEELY